MTTHKKVEILIVVGILVILGAITAARWASRDRLFNPSSHPLLIDE